MPPASKRVLDTQESWKAALIEKAGLSRKPLESGEGFRLESPKIHQGAPARPVSRRHFSSFQGCLCLTHRKAKSRVRRQRSGSWLSAPIACLDRHEPVQFVAPLNSTIRACPRRITKHCADI